MHHKTYGTKEEILYREMFVAAAPFLVILVVSLVTMFTQPHS